MTPERTLLTFIDTTCRAVVFTQGATRMHNHIDIEIIQSSLDNGRIYFSASDKPFFPDDSLGGRQRDAKGKAVTFKVGGEDVVTDIRIVSRQRIGPRKSFLGYLNSVRAKAGDRLRVARVGERLYAVEHIPG